MRCTGGLLLFFISTSWALYSSNDDVIQLDASNFNTRVVNSDELWLVEFYAPWCGHCKNLAPQWKEAASSLKGIANIAAVDMDVHSSVGSPYGIRGFPTIKVFGYDKSSPKDYDGGRTAEAIVKHAMQALQEMVRERSGGGKKRSGGSEQRSGDSSDSGSSDAVVVLTDDNFRELVEDSEETWLVEFFAPWCGHCKNLAPHWAKAAAEVKEKTGGVVKLGALDATAHQRTAGKFNVRGYPTIKIFRSGLKNQDPIDFQGGRDTSSIVNVAMEYYVENIDPPSIDQILNKDVLEEKCGKTICVLAFLPDIYEGGKVARDGYIKVLNNMGEAFKKQKWGWGWSTANAQPKLEKAFNIGGSGYPMLVGLNIRKQVYAVNMAAFNEDGIRPFLHVMTYGRGTRNTFPLTSSDLPEANEVEPWDGKEPDPIEEEEYDLGDFKWDDDEDEEPKKHEEL